MGGGSERKEVMWEGDLELRHLEMFFPLYPNKNLNFQIWRGRQRGDTTFGKLKEDRNTESLLLLGERKVVEKENNSNSDETYDSL